MSDLSLAKLQSIVLDLPLVKIILILDLVLKVGPKWICVKLKSNMEPSNKFCFGIQYIGYTYMGTIFFGMIWGPKTAALPGHCQGPA